MAKRQPVEALTKGGSMKYADDNEYDENGNMKKGGGYRKGMDGKYYKQDKEMSKALGTDDLSKALDQLETFTQDDTSTRKDTLLAKAQNGEELSKSENEELFNLLGGGTESETPEPLTRSMEENETLNKAMEVSDFLGELGGELIKAMGALEQRQDEASARSQQFDLVLAKSVVAVGRQLETLTEVVQTMAGQPTGRPRSLGAPNAQPMHKSFGGEAPAGEQLSKSQLQDGINSLFRESLEKGGHGKLNGIDLEVEASKFESTGSMHPAVYEAVLKHINPNRAAH